VRLQAAVAVLRLEGTSASPEVIERIDAACTSIRRSDPDDAALALLEAELRGLEGRRDDAVAIYRRVLDADDLAPAGRMIARNNLAMLLARGETADEARRLIDAAIADQGPHPSLIDTQGVVLLATGAVDEAIAALREALLDPSPEKHLHLACALAARRRFEAARRSLAEARKAGLDVRRLDPDDRERLEAVEAAIANPAS
jgi:tetratricopeptide (TPR) repeat protein